MTWVGDRAGANESVRGAIIVGRADENLKASVRSNDRLSLWQCDGTHAVRRVALA